MKEFKKTGYLNNDFKIFHLIDQGMAPVNFHFHEFHKILILFCLLYTSDAADE